MFNYDDVEEFEKNIAYSFNNKDNNFSLLELISTFEDEIQKNIEHKNKYRLVFYRRMFETVVDSIQIDLLYEIVNKIVSVMETSENDFDKYCVIMDVYILSAIRLYFDKIIDKSKEYFVLAVSFGEKNKHFSLVDFYNSLNCAYSWLGVIYYNDNMISDAIECFNTAISHYNEVKDNPKYFVREKDVIKLCYEYINLINNSV